MDGRWKVLSPSSSSCCAYKKEREEEKRENLTYMGITVFLNCHTVLSGSCANLLPCLLAMIASYVVAGAGAEAGAFGLSIIILRNVITIFAVSFCIPC